MMPRTRFLCGDNQDDTPVAFGVKVNYKNGRAEERKYSFKCFISFEEMRRKEWIM